MPVAQVSVSKFDPLWSVTPPYPFHRPRGSMKSRPASSAMRASFWLFSQLASHRSGTVVTASPPEQFTPNRPRLSLLRSSCFLGCSGLPGIRHVLQPDYPYNITSGPDSGNQLKFSDPILTLVPCSGNTSRRGKTANGRPVPCLRPFPLQVIGIRAWPRAVLAFLSIEAGMLLVGAAIWTWMYLRPKTHKDSLESW